MVKETRNAGGMVLKEKDEPIITMPVKDRGAGDHAPIIDISAGFMKGDESPRYLQWGEGAEEVVMVDQESIESDTLQMYLPDVINVPKADIVDRVEEFYEFTVEKCPNSDLPSDYNINFTDSDILIPDGEALDEITEYSGYRTGVVLQPPMDEDDIESREHMNYFDMDTPDSAVPLDLEHLGQEDNLDPLHLNRADIEISVKTGETTLYRGGKELYSGLFDEVVEFVNDEYDDDAYPELDNPFNVKSAAAVQGLGVEPHESIQEYLE